MASADERRAKYAQRVQLLLQACGDDVARLADPTDVAAAPLRQNPLRFVIMDTDRFTKVLCSVFATSDILSFFRAAKKHGFTRLKRPQGGYFVYHATFGAAAPASSIDDAGREYAGDSPAVAPAPVGCVPMGAIAAAPVLRVRAAEPTIPAKRPRHDAEPASTAATHLALAKAVEREVATKVAKAKEAMERDFAAQVAKAKADMAREYDLKLALFKYEIIKEREDLKRDLDIVTATVASVKDEVQKRRSSSPGSITGSGHSFLSTLSPSQAEVPNTPAVVTPGDFTTMVGNIDLFDEGIADADGLGLMGPLADRGMPLLYGTAYSFAAPPPPPPPPPSRPALPVPAPGADVKMRTSFKIEGAFAPRPG